jgi:hypothetical protein
LHDTGVYYSKIIATEEAGKAFLHGNATMINNNMKSDVLLL